MATWLKRARDLSADESELKASMDPEVAAAVSNKRILGDVECLQFSRCVSCGAESWPELEWQPPTNMLPGKFTPALATAEDVQANVARIRPKPDQERTGSEDDHVDQVVWSKTLEELKGNG